jgi:hypothetical protein
VGEKVSKVLVCSMKREKDLRDLRRREEKIPERQVETSEQGGRIRRG